MKVKQCRRRTSGITALKILVDQGLDVVAILIEKSNEVGGNWIYSEMKVIQAFLIRHILFPPKRSRNTKILAFGRLRILLSLIYPSHE